MAKMLYSAGITAIGGMLNLSTENVVASYFEGFADKLTTLSDSDTIWSKAFEHCQTLGFAGCSLVLAHGSANGVHTPMIKSNFSEEFNNAYTSEGLGEIDPFLLFSCKTLSAKNCH